MFPKNITKMQGHDFNYFQKLNITWGTFGGGNSDGVSPDMIITFSTQGIMLLNEDSSSIVEVSYNGTTVHDELNPAISQIKGIMYNNRVVSLIWFRLKTGASATVSVRAWAVR